MTRLAAAQDLQGNGCQNMMEWSDDACVRVAGEAPMGSVTFQLNGEYVALNQLLKLVGACDSGGAGKALVASGAVQVDGQTELRKTAKIRAGQVVSCGDWRILVQDAAAGGLPDGGDIG